MCIAAFIYRLKSFFFLVTSIMTLIFMLHGLPSCMFMLQDIQASVYHNTLWILHCYSNELLLNDYLVHSTQTHDSNNAVQTVVVPWSGGEHSSTSSSSMNTFSNPFKSVASTMAAFSSLISKVEHNKMTAMQPSLTLDR